jgi:hypothetical protein
MRLVLNPGFYNPENTLFPNSRREAFGRANQHLNSLGDLYKARIDNKYAEEAEGEGGASGYAPISAARPAQPSSSGGGWGTVASEALKQLPGLVNAFRSPAQGPPQNLPQWSGSAAFRPGTFANSFNYTPSTSFTAPSFSPSSVNFNPEAFKMPSLIGGG